MDTQLICEKKRIGVFLSLVDGGSYQYILFILDALKEMQDRYQVICVYDTNFWEERLTQQYSFIERQFVKSDVVMLAQTIDALKCEAIIFPMDGRPALASLYVKTPVINIIHDITCYYDRSFPVHQGMGDVSHYYQAFCRHSIGIFVDSNLGKKQLLDVCGHIYDAKIAALPFRASNYLFPGENETSYPLHNKMYVFYPSRFGYHKNHINLLLALDKLNHEGVGVNLLFTGSKDDEAYAQIHRLIIQLELAQQVEIVDGVDDSQMKYLYKHARAMIMPTFDGPTNIPPVEAIYSRCPVAVSNIGAMPQQIGDAGLTFNPASITDIADVLKKLWTDDTLCHSLVENSAIQRMGLMKNIFNEKFIKGVERFLTEEKKRFLHLKNLLQVCHEFRAVYLYGAGEYGYWIYEYLKQNDIDIKGFIVSHKEAGKQRYLGKRIYETADISEPVKDTLIVLSVHPHYHAEIINLLHRTLQKVNYYVIAPEHVLESFQYFGQHC